MTHSRFDFLPLFWKLYIFIVAMMVFVVGLAEFILEPLAENMLATHLGLEEPWGEVLIWIISIFVPALACGYIFSKMVTARMEKLTRVSKALAHGNFKARLPVMGNEKDAFDVMAQNFNEMAEAIEGQFRNERRLLADISHELRSPLTRMTIAAELLPRRRGQAGAESIMMRLNREIERMNELVALLLAQGRDKLLYYDTAHVVDLREVLGGLVEDFTLQGEMQNKRIELTLQGELTIVGSPLLLQRVFSNLLSNAMFYMPTGSKVEISAVGTAEGVTITVRDYGPGVPDEQLQDIFRAFYRVDNSRARTSGGVGLGLALVREAVMAHNGSVEAENSRPGLLVRVLLPAATINN